MPLEKYFKGHGKSVLASLRKAHPKWSEKKIKSVFYATAKKKGMEA